MSPDGTGTGNDLSEGTVLRLLYALEALYPAALVKEGAMRWRVVPRGAGYHHMLGALEKLGRGEIAPQVEPKAEPRLRAATASPQAVAHRGGGAGQPGRRRRQGEGEGGRG